MPGKKILSILIKFIIGVGSFLLVYVKLRHDLTPEKISLLTSALFSARGILCLCACLALIPVNWGLETYKWQIITRPVEAVNFKTATQSIYSGVCLGNLAPGRATEFVAKILFFKPEHRPQVSVLHFVGGLFQFSVTIVAGLAAMYYYFANFGTEHAWLPWTVGSISAIVIAALVISIVKIDRVLHYIVRKFSKGKDPGNFEYRFTPSLLSKLFAFSIIRYVVFSFQFVLLMMVFDKIHINISVLAEVALYFLITATIPMISLAEAAIRTAVALVVFKGAGLDTELAIVSVLIWLANIILPSIVGYIFLVRRNFDFKVMMRRK